MSNYCRNDFAWPEETAAALRSRLRFVAAALEDIGAAEVLDVGCGTGEQLTAPLATLCPGCRFLGTDDDAASIDYACSHFAMANIQFSPQLPPADRRFDAVIASEVLEHVARPAAFLQQLGHYLRPGGRLILTVPNGYGCSEWMSLAENLALLSGIWTPVLRLKRWVLGGGRVLPADTAAISPHINFFSYSRLLKLFDRLDLTVINYQGRMFLHNFLVSSLIDRSRGLADLNAAAGRRLPAAMVSDWMFVLECPATPVNDVAEVARNRYERLKGSINRRRWGLN